MTAENNIKGNISIRDVKRVFNQGTASELVALDCLNMEIRSGEFISLIGPSGCGKSTLLRLISGLDVADEGNIRLDDQVISEPHHERGLVFQDPTLFPWLSVHDNIASGLKARGVYKQNKAIVNDYINLIGLKGFESAYPHHLSGGMAQRTSLARSLVNHPKVLLLDEPFGALDAFTRMQMQDELMQIWQERGTTMILVTHDVDEAVYLSDRIVIMTERPGKVEKILEVAIARPRARNHADFLSLRVEILEILHFAKKTII